MIFKNVLSDIHSMQQYKCYNYVWESIYYPAKMPLPFERSFSQLVLVKDVAKSFARKTAEDLIAVLKEHPKYAVFYFDSGEIATSKAAAIWLVMNTYKLSRVNKLKAVLELPSIEVG